MSLTIAATSIKSSLFSTGIKTVFTPLLYEDGDLTVDFIAAGLTTIAKHYLMDDASWSNKELSDTILRLFSGDYF